MIKLSYRAGLGLGLLQVEEQLLNGRFRSKEGSVPVPFPVRKVLIHFLSLVSVSLVMVSGSEWMSQLGEFLNRDGFLPKKEEKGLAE